MRLLRHLTIVAALLSAMPAVAVQPDEVLSDPSLEARARELSRELRCMVCQNQSIDDSDAPLARDLRILVRERLQAGDSNRQVLDFLVDRYGEFVLLRPRLNWRTSLLWLAPPALLIVGAIVLLVVARRRARTADDSAKTDDAGAPLSPAEQARLARLTQSGER
jgi:cytochrome c-type biogenesis protein CcmH